MGVELEEFRHCGRRFGYGGVLTNYGDSFLKESLGNQVTAMGWSHGCPSVDVVIAGYGCGWAKSHAGASPEEMKRVGMQMALSRYAECNLMFGYMVDEARKLNPFLYRHLVSPVLRLPEEPDGVRWTKYIPVNAHKREMSPMSTPWGYALPRVAIEQMGRGEENCDRTQGRILVALELVEEVIQFSKTPVELVVRLAGAVIRADADAKMVLSHLLSRDVLREENCSAMFFRIVEEMKRLAPHLYEVYKRMGAVEKYKLGIINVGDRVAVSQRGFSALSVR